MSPRYLHGAIGAAGVHHHDVIGKADGCQTLADMGFLVQGNDGDG